MAYDLILKNGTVGTPSGLIEADVGITDGTITTIGTISSQDAKETIDCTGLHVLPGVIDTQVHFREPGNEHKEDLATGTLSAVAGGVTGIFEMPNTNPLTTSKKQLDDKVTRATGRSWCDFAFFVGGTADNAQQNADLETVIGCCGTKIFMGSSTGNLLLSDDEGIEAVMRNGRRRISIHAEDEPRLKERQPMTEEDGVTHALHPVWRDEETAILATKRVIASARKTGRKIHVLHITTKQEMDILAENKDIVTVETTPQHLTLSAPDCYERLGGLAQMNPPIRTQDHQDGLWQAIREGVVDVIGSDHAPHTLEEKANPYPNSPSGMPGVQTLVPIMLNHVNEGRLTLERFIDLTSHGAQRIFNIARKGRIAKGYDADFTIVDMKEKRTIENSWIKSKCGWTPYDGMTVQGWPKATIIRGHIVMKDDEILNQPVGQPVRFIESVQDQLAGETVSLRTAV